MIQSFKCFKNQVCKYKWISVYSLYIPIWKYEWIYIELNQEHYTLNIFTSTFHAIICQIYVFIFYDFTQFLFIYLVFGCAGCSLLRGLSLVAASGATFLWGAWASHCRGFSCCNAQALGIWASVFAACRL